jgi:tetratricopeptide (TPR) repeat protein
MSKASGRIWKREQIEQIKSRIRQELAPFQSSLDRIPYLLHQISQAEEREPDRLIYVMTLLNTHVREGGLTDLQVKELFQLAEALLTLQNIKPKSSSLAFLLGEFHILKAQLHMNDGEPLLACIEQQLVEHVSGTELPGGKSFQSLSLARMSLRLGEAELAVDYIDRALQHGLDPNFFAYAQLIKLRSFRLSHRVDDADALTKELLKEDLDPRTQREIQWESLCRQVFRAGSIDGLMEIMNPRRDFYQASYILESFFWIRAITGLQWMEHLPKLKSLSQKKNLNFKANSAYLRCASHLERAYDKDIPLSHRLMLVKKTLQAVHTLPDIDKVLLVHLALVRWLIRSQSRELARFVYSEYATLSQRLSGTADALGIAADLSQKTWHK